MTAGCGKTTGIAGRRKKLQWLSTLILLGVPFVRVGGESLLRLDAGSRTLHLFGANLRIEEFYLFLLAVLILVFGFLAVTMLFGRVWCGWLCPQTTVCDLADWTDAGIDALPFPRAPRAVLRQLPYLLISVLIACNLIWYFIPPGEFMGRLLAGEIGTVAGISLTAVSLLVYLDLSLVRRSFCRSVCPYGRIQLLTMERGTLTLEFDPARKDACLDCGACLRACPMGIDIRRGLQIECINCGRCLDACREVMAKRGEPGLIHYSFGVPPGEPLPLKRRALFMGVVLAVLVALLAVGLGHRQVATLKVQRAAGGKVTQLPDGALVNFYAVYLENRGIKAGIYSLEAAPWPGYRLELIGPVRELQVAANANRKVDLVLKVTPAPAAGRDLEVRLVSAGRIVAVATLPLLTR